MIPKAMPTASYALYDTAEATVLRQDLVHTFRVLGDEGRALLLLSQKSVAGNATRKAIAAAIAARRTGAQVTLVERYNHFGGLWTGGLLLVVYHRTGRRADPSRS